MSRVISVLVVDDSAVVRQVFRGILEADSEIRVTAVAKDPFEAVASIAKAVPDVMIVDVEMPRMDGITFLRKVMSQYPIPTIVCSTFATVGSDVAFEASRAGAVEVLRKPAGFARSNEFATELREAVKTAKSARVRVPLRAVSVPDRLRPAATETAQRSVAQAKNSINIRCAGVAEPANQSGNKRTATASTKPALIAIGASTGGTEAIRQLLVPMDDNMPPIVIVQHMPAGFTTSFASWLNSCCRVSVSEASDGQIVARGQAVVARGGMHMRVRQRNGQFTVHLGDDAPINRHRPSVDALFDSVTTEVGSRALGVLLTGMGDDGAEGMLRLRQAGATTIAESEASAVVFGMPKEAILRGGAELVLGLNEISAFWGSVPTDEVL